MNDAMVTLRSALSLVAVLALLGLFVWALRRGSLRLFALAPRGLIAIETAMSLGDRRSLAIVGVEGRRLLIGLTPTTISLLTDLTPGPAAAATPGGALASTEGRTP
jgi:flagellar biogenesis protein FliO